MCGRKKNILQSLPALLNIKHNEIKIQIKIDQFVCTSPFKHQTLTLFENIIYSSPWRLIVSNGHIVTDTAVKVIDSFVFCFIKLGDRRRRCVHQRFS